MAKQKTLHDAFYETLKDVYYAEKQSVKALKKSAKAAEHAELRQAFETHAEESAQQVERLTQVFEIIGKPARAKTCEAMQGIVSEMEEDLEDFEGSPAADAVLAACAQAVEHYEISPLRHPEDLGRPARLRRGRQAAGRDPAGGEEDRRPALQDRRVDQRRRRSRGCRGSEGQGLEEGRLSAPSGRHRRGGAGSRRSRHRPSGRNAKAQPAFSIALSGVQ